MTQEKANTTKCEDCGKADGTVYNRECGYAIEMANDWNHRHTVCDECEAQHCQDV